MQPERLIRLRLEMEFGAPLAGDDLPAARAEGEAVPRFIVSQHAAGFTRFYRHDVPRTTRDALAALGPQRAVDDAAAVAGVLARDSPSGRVWRVCWYTITTPPPATDFADARATPNGYVIERDGSIVARAWTTADSPRATEVEVETHADYRRRGYARQVVAAWAAAALHSGKAVFYSHLASNDASRGVARSLGLEWLSDEVEYE